MLCFDGPDNAAAPARGEKVWWKFRWPPRA